MKKNHDAAFKAMVALEAVKDEDLGAGGRLSEAVALKANQGP